MTTQELHIQLHLLLQKVNSHWNSNFLPQEIDTFINREILKFIKQRLNPLSNPKRQVVFDTIKRTQDLNSIIKTVPIEVVNINPKEVGYQLPFDFLYYISSTVGVTPTCQVDTVDTINKTAHYKSFKPITNYNDVTELIINIGFNLTIIEVFKLSTLPPNYLPLDSTESYKKNFIINNAILLKLKELVPSEIEVRYNNSLQIFEFRCSGGFTVEVLLNGNPQTIVTHNKTSTGYNQSNSLDSEVRIVDEEFKTNINRSYLSKAKDESLVGYLRNDSVILPKIPNAVLNNGFLTYFCKPKKVDVLLNYNSEFPDEVLDEVVSNLVQQIKGIIASDTYEKYSQENLIIE